MKKHNQELLQRDEVIAEQDMELQVKFYFLHNIQCINNIIICSIKSIVKSQHVTILS